MLKISIQVPAGAGRGLDLIESPSFRMLEDKAGRDEAVVAHRKSIVPLCIHSVENIYEISGERCQVGYTASEESCRQEVCLWLSGIPGHLKPRLFKKHQDNKRTEFRS